jgi:hypothetical protein
VNLGVVLTDMVRNGSLAHGGRTREHDESAAGGAASVLFSLDHPVAKPGALAGAESGESFGVRYPEFTHRLFGARRSEPGHAGEQIAHPEAALRGG